MNVTVIIQARTGSTRLPRKVLLPLAGRPLLDRMIERVRAARSVDTIVVATTTLADDAPVVRLCEEMNVPVTRGHPTDLLDRHMQAALAARADAVVKIPSDCPLIDPGVVDHVVGAFRAAGSFDYMSNLHPASYPDGNDVEIMTMRALTNAWRHARHAYEREHTTPYFLNHPDVFRLGNITWPTGRDLSRSHRWTIDYPEDYLLIKEIYNGLWNPRRPVFPLESILQWLDAHPEIARANAMYAGQSWWHNVPELGAMPWAVAPFTPNAFHAQ